MMRNGEKVYEMYVYDRFESDALVVQYSRYDIQISPHDHTLCVQYTCMPLPPSH